MLFMKEKKEYTIKIDGMKCMHCQKNVENTLSKMKGVKKVEVNLEEKYAKVLASVKNESEFFDDVKAKIEEAGFSVIDIA